jgi:hypothetical protein
MKAARHRIERTAPHSLLATLVGASAVALPFLVPDPNISPETNVIGYLGGFMESAQTGDQYGMAWNAEQMGKSFVDGVVTSLPALVGLGAVAAGIGWAGRKFGKSATNVSRKWRVF